MSIASEIQRISGCREDIKNAIAAKGVTVPATATLSSCPDLIGSIQTGGGGGGSYMFDASVIAPFTGYKTASFTATQNAVSAGDWNDVTLTFDSSSIDGRDVKVKYTMPVSALICADTIPMSSFVHLEFVTKPERLTFSRLRVISYYNSYYGENYNSYYMQINDLTGECGIDTGYWNFLRNRCYFDRWGLQDSATDLCYVEFWMDGYDVNYNNLQPTAINISSKNYIVTGTAYPYPERPVTITGNTSAICSGYCNFTRPTGSHNDSYIDLAQHVFASANLEMSNGNTSAIPTRRDDSYSFFDYPFDAVKNLPRWTVGDLPRVVWNLDSVTPDSAYSVSYSNENWNYSTTGYVYSSNLS